MTACAVSPVRTSLAADDERDLDALAGHGGEARLELGALGGAGRVRLTGSLTGGGTRRMPLNVDKAALLLLGMEAILALLLGQYRGDLGERNLTMASANSY